ncbi:MAG: hypothetical protein GX442_18385 [Candidatus Riflebacteria bacterium]|nr:hypothetical protein [Candidatus Riflebacteria bacterium]
MSQGQAGQPWPTHPEAGSSQDELVIRLPRHLFRKEGDALVLHLKLVLENAETPGPPGTLDVRSLW